MANLCDAKREERERGKKKKEIEREREREAERDLSQSVARRCSRFLFTSLPPSFLEID